MLSYGGNDMRILVILAAIVSMLPLSAQAQSVQQVFRQFGLIGVWARACDQPADLESGNQHAIYALHGADGVMITYENGPKYRPSFYTVLSAERMGRNCIVYVEQRLNTDQRATITVEKFGQDIGLTSSVLEDGTVLVKDGKVTATGQPNPHQSLCRG